MGHPRPRAGPGTGAGCLGVARRQTKTATLHRESTCQSERFGHRRSRRCVTRERPIPNDAPTSQKLTQPLRSALGLVQAPGLRVSVWLRAGRRKPLSVADSWVRPLEDGDSWARGLSRVTADADHRALRPTSVGGGYHQSSPRKRGADYEVSSGSSKRQHNSVCEQMRRWLRNAPGRAAASNDDCGATQRRRCRIRVVDLARRGIRGGLWRRSGRIAAVPGADQGRQSTASERCGSAAVHTGVLACNRCTHWSGWAVPDMCGVETQLSALDTWAWHMQIPRQPSRNVRISSDYRETAHNAYYVCYLDLHFHRLTALQVSAPR